MTFRLDRFLTLYLFGPLSRLRKPKGLRIPILMYHSISDERETRHPYYWINTSPARFAEHMKYLHDNNYQVIRLSAAVEMIRSQSVDRLTGLSVDSLNISAQPPSQPLNQSTIASPSHPVTDSTVVSCGSSVDPLISSRSHSPNCPLNQSTVLPPNQPITQSTSHDRYAVLTFDDGYLDFYTHAFPILQRYRFTATVFLPTAYIDGKRPGIRGKEHLNWDQVRELHSAGIDFGSHTVNHPQLYDLDWPDIEYELRTSKKAIEVQIKPDNRVIDCFCYPYKFVQKDDIFLRSFFNLMVAEGYRACTTTRIGITTHDKDVFRLQRIPVSEKDDYALFSAKLFGAYNWLSIPQRLSKRAISSYD